MSEFKLGVRADFDALQHVALLCQNPYPEPPQGSTHERGARQQARVEFVATLMSMGALLVDDQCDPVQHEVFFASGEHRYTFQGQKEYTNSVLARLPELVPGLKQPMHSPYLEACDAGIGERLPYMLVVSEECGGDGKYLVETPQQHNIASSYIRARTQDSFVPTDPRSIIAKDFIRTPGERYTSYRVLTTATGTPVAAGLLYSAHKKNDDKLVTASYGGLANADTQFFLGARDVRSNVSKGGRVIPLMGDNRRDITSDEQGILAAHGIDPDNPALPEAVREQSVAVARTHGRLNDVYNGSDYIQSESGEIFFLEDNVGPGSETYRVCHFGDGAVNYSRVYSRVYSQVIDDLLGAA